MMRASIYFLVVVFLVGCQSSGREKSQAIELPYYSDETFSAEWISEDDPAYDSIHQVAPFSFINQEGDTITNNTFDDKVYVANFFFTLCPTVCPKMEANLSFVQTEFMNDDRVMMVSHTVMPWADSVKQLQEYAIRNEIDSRKWHLLTGDQSEIYKMGRLSYFADEGFGKGVTDLDDFLHTENIVLVDQNRRIRGIYNGTLKLEMKRMIEDIEYLLKKS